MGISVHGVTWGEVTGLGMGRLAAKTQDTFPTGHTMGGAPGLSTSQTAVGPVGVRECAMGGLGKMFSFLSTL